MIDEETIAEMDSYVIACLTDNGDWTDDHINEWLKKRGIKR